MSEAIEPVRETAEALFEAVFGGNADESRVNSDQFWQSARARGLDRFILIQGPTRAGEPSSTAFGTDVTASYPVRIPRGCQPNFVTVRSTGKGFDAVVAELKAAIGVEET
jgi:hypothetical protein